jgi:hypothetical protein
MLMLKRRDIVHNAINHNPEIISGSMPSYLVEGISLFMFCSRTLNKFFGWRSVFFVTTAGLDDVDQGRLDLVKIKG